MGRYQYRTITIEYQGKKVKDWVASGDSALVGMQAVLDRYAAEGWELMCLEPELMEAGPGFGRWFIETTAYRVVFRRAQA